MKNVAITGVSGYLGTQLLRRLEQEEEVDNIVGIDVNPPRHESPKLKFHSRDIRAPFKDILTENKIDTAVHFAFVVTPTRDQNGARQINIDGSRNFLESCQQAGVEQVFYMSSHTVYGAHADNPIPILEDAALRPNQDFPYSCQKAEVDQMFQEFADSQPDTTVTIIRTCSVVGPEAGVAGINVLFTPVMMRPMGYNPPWQFLHEDDLVESICLVLKQRQRGIFNSGGEGSATYKEMVAAAGKPCIVLPSVLLSLMVMLTWKLHLQSRSPSGVEFMKHPIVVDAEKLQKTTGFSFRHSSQDALLSLLSVIKGTS